MRAVFLLLLCWWLCCHCFTRLSLCSIRVIFKFSPSTARVEYNLLVHLREPWFDLVYTAIVLLARHSDAIQLYRSDPVVHFVAVEMFRVSYMLSSGMHRAQHALSSWEWAVSPLPLEWAYFRSPVSWWLEWSLLSSSSTQGNKKQVIISGCQIGVLLLPWPVEILKSSFTMSRLFPLAQSGERFHS